MRENIVTPADVAIKYGRSPPATNSKTTVSLDQSLGMRGNACNGGKIVVHLAKSRDFERLSAFSNGNWSSLPATVCRRLPPALVSDSLQSIGEMTMGRFQSHARLFFALAAASLPSAASAANLPTADEILQVHRTNKERLSQLHLQLVHRYETTEASCRQAEKQADGMEKFIAAASQMTPEVAELQFGGKQVKGEEALRLLQQMLPEMRRQAAVLRSQSKPFQILRPMEWFAGGVDYQFRQPLASFRTDEELAAWRFADAPLTPATLSGVYRDVSIFSRSSKSTPPARWWHHSADGHAYVMRKHLTDVSLVNMPPFSDAAHPRWDMRHPIDAFFSQSADKYRVVREEKIDGRSLVVVETAVPIDPASTTLLAYRAWLDLERGAVPIKMHHLQNTGRAPQDQFDRRQPSEIVTTREVRELPNGAFYPATTVREVRDRDPDAPEPTAAEMPAVPAGKRELPWVVVRRSTWECTLVELKTQFDDGFFAIPFPDGQKLFDHDAGKMVGALDPKPLVRVGEPAPPLSIALWLDGKRRTWDDLKGQVVVLDFWGLWCGACRGSVPKLKTLQERFRDKPVTFISIHTAENDPAASATRIRVFKAKNDWNFLGAIDAGRMIEDSVTANAYGVRGFPMLVIVDLEGEIAYVDPELDGPTCDETDPVVLADFQRKVDTLMKERFALVGEPWPVPGGLDDDRRMAIYERVDLAFKIKQIESALKQAR